MSRKGPIKNKVLAEILPDKETKSGLILMRSNLEKYRAKVTAIGPWVEHIKVGDVVRFNPHSAQYYENSVFLREDQDILFVV